MQNYENIYNALKIEYENYQMFSEKHIQELNQKNIKLEKNIDSLSNIIEVSNYINTFFSSDNLISMINDMILGIFGVKYSTIFLIEDSELIVKASNIENMYIKLTSEELMHIDKSEEFLINSKEPLKQTGEHKVKIHSIMGYPIKLRNKFIGYIIVEHNIYKFMTTEMKLFLKSIANQIAIAIENSLLYKELEKINQRDALLGIYNRKYFFEYLEKSKCEKMKDKFAIVMIDIDDFKKINDIYGHQFGDKILINTAKIISSGIYEDDIMARYGGEEFILYISNFIDENSVYNKIEMIRGALESSKVSFNGKYKSVTASFGISFFPLNSIDINELIKKADDLLYKAKKSGKNKVLSGHIFKI
ncbi:MAG: sensor domain-containing diguanylate cyclase [Clostridium sp.]|uniref:sensor domain-containing diguanylate cyclase n=1 Tax=Clostridium sp. TaxID=1506 RepID=UPI0025BBEA04|nr:sensor domain-containing diguanylate cyclase [Clostridium sp.]MCE5219910.1 sensor domain-containing diguanylate cyclase [Clostridium sp.]